MPVPLPGGGVSFAGYPQMMAPKKVIKHPVSMLNEKLGPGAKIEYEFGETGDSPATKFFQCTLTLGKEGEAQFIARKGAPIGIFTGEARSKKEAKRLAAVDALDKLFNTKVKLANSNKAPKEPELVPTNPLEKALADTVPKN